jgi:hypothetical protein
MRYLARRRFAALSAAAFHMGLKFEGQEWESTSQAPEMDSPLFAMASPHPFANILTGSRNGIECSFFDYTIGGGRRSIHQTVAMFIQAFAMPTFEISPQDVVHRLGDKILHKEIGFASHPDISKRYRILSTDELRARELLTPALLEFLEGLDPKPKWHIEGSGHTLVIFRFGKIIEVENYVAFVKETSRIAGNFIDLSG